MRVAPGSTSLTAVDGLPWGRIDSAEELLVGSAEYVSDALRRLSVDHRRILVELHYRGRSIDEAADQLGLAPDVVKARSYAALRALRAIVARP